METDTEKSEAKQQSLQWWEAKKLHHLAELQYQKIPLEEERVIMADEVIERCNKTMVRRAHMKTNWDKKWR